MYLLLFLFGLANALPIDQSAAVPLRCPDGYVGHLTSCFKLIKELASWAEAKVYCSVMHARLAIITSQARQDFIVEMVKDSSLDPFIWLDATDMQEEGTWRWMSSNTVVSYAAWYSGEPNNVSGREECLALKKIVGYKWIDWDCENKGNFMCEISLSEDWNNGIIG